MLWKRFRAACDYFFDNKEKNYGGVDPQYVENLNKKLAIIEEIKAYEPEDRASDAEAMKEFMNRWNEIGFVPFKEKEKVQAMFKEALNSKFHGVSRSRRGGGKPQKETNPLRTEREKLVQKFRKKESEIATYENNIGFFASSKNADALVKELSKKIEAAKAELAELEEKIKEIDNQFE
jgi:DNA repair exonuclease SbcCD ATPase subunit